MSLAKTGALAVHTQVGDAHAVGVLALRVLLVEDTTGWFAQGLDIDYAASGDSEEGAKSAFETGFYATVHEHLVMNGSMDRLLKPAPKAVWDEFYAAARELHFSCVQLHLTGKAAAKVGFDHLQFMTTRESKSASAVAA